MFCPLNDFDSLKLNHNTGIEYEFGVGMALMLKSQYNDFLKNIVQDHPKKNKVMETYNITKDILSKKLTNLEAMNNRYISFAPTQNDRLGPSDILVCNNKEILFGISIKYTNSNNWNPSAKNFLDSEIIKKLKLIYIKDYRPRYIQDMRSRFGQCKLIKGTRNTWSRKRSSVTDDFIDLIRDELITSWENKDLSERKLILNKGFSQILSASIFSTIGKSNFKGWTLLLSLNLFDKVELSQSKKMTERVKFFFFWEISLATFFGSKSLVLTSIPTARFLFIFVFIILLKR